MKARPSSAITVDVELDEILNTDGRRSHFRFQTVAVIRVLVLTASLEPRRQLNGRATGRKMPSGLRATSAPPPWR